MSKYRINSVAQMTGLSAALIRAWESRYGLVSPDRTPAGYRLYSDEDVAVLQSAQRLVSQGMAPMQVAKLDRAALLREGDGGRRPLPSHPEGEAGPVLGPAGDLADQPELFAERIEQVIQAFASYDKGRVDELLGPPLAMLPVEMVCQQLLMPLLQEIGERWHRGALSVASEHFGTSFIRSKLLSMMEGLRQRGGVRRLLCACPPGEQHEIGLMMFALRSAAQGWEVIYLGANVPLSGLLDAVARTKPDLTALSFVQRLPQVDLEGALIELRAMLQGQTRLLVGGRGIDGHEELVLRTGCVLMPASGRLDDLIGGGSRFTA